MSTLYELTGAYNDILQAIMEAESGEEIAALTAQLEAIEGDWIHKAGSYARVLQELRTSEEALAKEVERLLIRKHNCAMAQEKLKSMMMMSMKTMNVKTVETDIGRWSIRKNAPSVEIIDASKIPKEYLIQQAPTISKTAILAVYKADGEIVPGCDIKQKESLQFR